LIERNLEFLYPEGGEYLFLDIGNLEQVLVPASILADKVHYLNEGIQVKAMFYGETIFSVELPQFLEIMVVKTEGNDPSRTGSTKKAVLETGANIEVPLFIESGDVIKVDTQTNDYVQRV
jgi:elongation factor P